MRIGHDIDTGLEPDVRLVIVVVIVISYSQVSKADHDRDDSGSY